MENKTKKTEIKVSVDFDFLKSLKENLGLTKSTDVIKVALSLLGWVSEETEKGRMILSANKEGKSTQRLVMPELSNIKSSEE